MCDDLRREICHRGAVKGLTLEQVRAEHDRLLACRSDHERLKMSSSADLKALRASFRSICRPYHPDLHRKREPEFRQTVQEIFILLSEAEERLRHALTGRGRSPSRAASSPGTSSAPTTPAKKTEFGRPANSAPKRTPSSFGGAVPDALLRRMGIAVEGSPEPTIPPAIPAAPVARSPSSPRPPKAPTAAAPAPAPAATATPSREPDETPAAKAEPTSKPEESAHDPDLIFGEALAMMIQGDHQAAADTLTRLMRERPDVTEYQSHRKIALARAARARQKMWNALLHYHGAFVIDGTCREALDALRAQHSIPQTEERLLNGMFGEV